MTTIALTRRLLIGSAIAGALPIGRALAATRQCVDGDEPTPRQTAGPYFTPNSPERRSLVEDGMAGDRILLTGTVLDRHCRPVPHALLDLWQADAAGVYDNSGYRLRGHQFSDAEGRYKFATIVPGLYPGRTRHFHVRVQAPQRDVLTTQLYFPGEAQNARDRIFSDALLLDLARRSDSAIGRYDFILDLG